MKIIVVGRGIGGSMVSHLARERGHEVRIIAEDREPDSLAATAVLREAYHANKPAELEAYRYAVSWYRERGVELRQGAGVSSYRKPDAGPRQDADWLLMDPAEVLVQADTEGTVLSATADRAWTGTGDADCVRGDAVVLATGAAKLFAPEDPFITWGLTWTHDASALKDPGQVKVFQYAPYRTLIAGVTGVKARVGSSSAKTREKAIEQGKMMLRTAWELGWLATPAGWTRIEGARLKTERLWGREQSGAWRIGGFHRTGYALAPAAARDLLDEIEKSA